MTAAELVNRIVEKLGGNRVEFLSIETSDSRPVHFDEVLFVHAGNLYKARSCHNAISIIVLQVQEQGPPENNNYSAWIAGVLNGQARDDAGVLS